MDVPAVFGVEKEFMNVPFIYKLLRLEPLFHIIVLTLQAFKLLYGEFTSNEPLSSYALEAFDDSPN